MPKKALHILLKKAITHGGGRSRFNMASVGLFISFLLLFISMQVQINYNNLLNGSSNKDSVANFIVINKKLTNKNIGSSTISDAEINDLKQQPFIERIGFLAPSRFKASIESGSKLFPFYTDIAFESVADEFIDIHTANWKWNEQEGIVPIIVPNMFLDFYNFQFAQSQNLPQLTQQVLQMVVFKLNIYSDNNALSFKGRVVGFSDRISSLLVPQSFMRWANQRLRIDTQNTAPSRVIIRTVDPGNPQLSNYLKTHGFTTDADKIRFSKYRQIIDWVVGIAAGTGIMMLAFALAFFGLFIHLTIAANKSTIILLNTLGMSPKQLSSFLMRRFVPVSIILCAAALLTTSLLQYILHVYISKFNITLAPFISWQLVAFLIILLTVIRLIYARNFKVILYNIN